MLVLLAPVPVPVLVMVLAPVPALVLVLVLVLVQVLVFKEERHHRRWKRVLLPVLLLVLQVRSRRRSCRWRCLQFGLFAVWFLIYRLLLLVGTLHVWSMVSVTKVYYRFTLLIDV